MRNKAKLLFGLPALFIFLPSSFAATPQYHWERIRVMHLSPSQAFVKLGLTHSTRFGHTRGTEKESDPNFPMGLTDIVPYDTDKVFLVRGTDKGLSLFRQTVAAADVPQLGWQVAFDLLDKDGTVIASSTQESVLPDRFFSIVLGQGPDSHSYRCRLHINPDHSIIISCQSGLFVASTSNAPVFMPNVVWSTSLSKPTPIGVATDFGDTTDAPATAGTLPSVPKIDDHLRVTVMPQAAPAPEKAN